MSWIAVGLSADVSPGMAMPGHLQGHDIAIWRTASGKVHVWGDRCPHRGMRLSHGFVRGEALSCIYHGWQYGADGGCTHIPAHPDLVPPKTICATTFSSTEADGVIWAALRPTTTATPDCAGLIALRSLTIDASPERVARHFGQAQATLLRVMDNGTLMLALQQTSDESCAVHALMDPSRDRKEASRWLEAQRHLIEGGAA